MKTRRGIRYSGEEEDNCWNKKSMRNTRDFSGDLEVCRKRRKISPAIDGEDDEGFFDSLPDDLVLSILCKLGATARSPSDFLSISMTCKRLNGLAMNPHVLSRASPKSFAVKAKNWTESSHRFMKLCADAGNVEACYTLGMIRFYCLQNRGSGASLIAKAAMGSHAPALYSLALIQFNGSGGSKTDKDLRAGVALCARAAFLGHVDALRELGHCLQDGYGVHKNIFEGRRFLVQANARELASALSPPPQRAARVFTRSCAPWAPHPPTPLSGSITRCPLLSDFGCNIPAPEIHPANRFLTEWFGSRGGIPAPELRLCSHGGCGRPETRRHEFRRCSVCGVVNYCSRACQALDWKLRHKTQCMPVEQWVDMLDRDGNNVQINGNGNEDYNVVGQT